MTSPRRVRTGQAYKALRCGAGLGGLGDVTGSVDYYVLGIGWQF
ncbi:MAG: hypothetical protein OEO77_15245 [Acidimicrobiia bacterium]|nr:hypothetical protein [Acidimicrobiia bacterium]